MLTKPLGAGAVTTSLKKGLANDDVLARAVEVMTELNAAGAQAARVAGAHAMTDVTGFGLLGHLYKMCRASGVGAVIDVGGVPVIESARDALRDGSAAMARFVSSTA